MVDVRFAFSFFVVLLKPCLLLDLSIIIVNYNVKHFLEQCLYATQKAITGLSAEVIVVDNNSSDGSEAYLRPAFPFVRFIINQENVGFAKACNQGRDISSGKKILFLNPDTIVAEDCFLLCLEFFKTHPDAGALGVKMLDGSGKFLKESKRSFPEPVTSFFKLAGLSRLFPYSRTFSRYHLGYLNENENHEVDVLAGAFMMIRKEVLDLTGGFDETFFMYGEDVDLSYRIQKAGYKNYYFAGSSIIHFKGESTKKGSLNYVRMFYNAMSIFVRKHYGENKAGLFNLFIHLAIWSRAALTAIANFIRRFGLPLIDAALIMLSFWLMKNIWNRYIRPDIEYETTLLWIAIPSFTLSYLIAAYYAGLYDRWYKRSGLVQSTLLATIVLLAIYSLLPEQYRFSRGIILFGAMLGFVLMSILRWALVSSGVLSNKPWQDIPSVLIIGSPVEYHYTLQVIKDAGIQDQILGRGAIDAQDNTGIDYQKKTAIGGLPANFYELIFCEGTLTFKEIINRITQLPVNARVKIHASNSRSIVGSESKDGAGESLSKENGFLLSDPHNRRLKRLLDICLSIFGIILFPLHSFFIKNPGTFLLNCFNVLIGRRTWIGYALEEQGLPQLRKGIVGSNGQPVSDVQQLPAESLHMLDYRYARDYRPGHDLKIIRNVYTKLGG
jgi:GT2 family glycosyltransferase